MGCCLLGETSDRYALGSKTSDAVLLVSLAIGAFVKHLLRVCSIDQAAPSVVLNVLKGPMLERLLSFSCWLFLFMYFKWLIIIMSEWEFWIFVGKQTKRYFPSLNLKYPLVFQKAKKKKKKESVLLASDASEQKKGRRSHSSNKAYSGIVEAGTFLKFLRYCE